MCPGRGGVGLQPQGSAGRDVDIIMDFSVISN